MSIRLMSEVWRTNLPTTEKMVLLVVADHASDDGTNAYPSQATIASKASISVRTVQRCINNLVKARYLIMDKHAGGSANCRDDRRPHLYTICLDKLRGDILTTRNDRGDIDYTNGVTSTPTTGRHSRPKNYPLEPPLEPPYLFDDFWEIYPLKIAKKTAKIAYQKAIKSTKAEVILEGAKRYANDPKRHPSYTVHPTTWLNQERWADAPLPEREITPEERKEQELLKARERDQRERERSARISQELAQTKAEAVPMPESIREIFYSLRK